MANAITLTGRYLLEGLEIFLRPVTVLRRAAERGDAVPLPTLVMTGILVVAAGIALDIANGQLPGMAFETYEPSLVAFGLDVLAGVLMAGLMGLLLFLVSQMLGTGASLTRAVSVNIGLQATVFGGFVFVLLLKGIVFVLSPFDQTSMQTLIHFGPQASLLLGMIVTLYSIIAARFGALVSWPLAVLIAVTQLILIVALSFGFSLFEVNSAFNDLQDLLPEVEN